MPLAEAMGCALLQEASPSSELSADPADNSGHRAWCFAPAAKRIGHGLAKGIEFLGQHRYAGVLIGPSMSQLGLPKQWSGVSMFIPKRMLCFR